MGKQHTKYHNAPSNKQIKQYKLTDHSSIIDSHSELECTCCGSDELVCTQVDPFGVHIRKTLKCDYCGHIGTVHIPTVLEEHEIVNGWIEKKN